MPLTPAESRGASLRVVAPRSQLKKLGVAKICPLGSRTHRSDGPAVYFALEPETFSYTPGRGVVARLNGEDNANANARGGANRAAAADVRPRRRLDDREVGGDSPR